MITITFYFTAEESIFIRKKLVSVNSMGHDLNAIFL